MPRADQPQQRLTNADDVSITQVPAAKVINTMADDVRTGLTVASKRLHPKYFYDQQGSQLFDQICDTPEYYLTRVENALLARSAGDIIDRTEPNNIIEFGSGTSRKTRTLLDAWEGRPGQRVYWPFDVSEELLRQVAAQLSEEYPRLSVQGLIGDYTAGLSNLPPRQGSSLMLFVGSTLGNFEQTEAVRFVTESSELLSAGDYFLLGVDLHKDHAVLQSAYNDSAGVTAAFNKNVLTVINRELSANFDLARFQHRAVYNRELHQIEMYLDSIGSQQVTIEQLELTVDFADGEPILTEISRKFEPEQIDLLFERAGLEPITRYIDAHFPYIVALGRKR